MIKDWIKPHSTKFGGYRLAYSGPFYGIHKITDVFFVSTHMTDGIKKNEKMCIIYSNLSHEKKRSKLVQSFLLYRLCQNLVSDGWKDGLMSNAIANRLLTGKATNKQCHVHFVDEQ